MISKLISITDLRPVFREGAEARLWLAVLYRAVLDMQGRVGQNANEKYQSTHIQKEACKWIFSDDFETGSCLWILDKFFEDPEHYMKLLRQLAIEIKNGKPVAPRYANIGHARSSFHRTKKST